MRLTEYERVIYKKNTIEEVICQLRFPTTLKIDNPAIASFQDAIRRDYPDYQSGDSIVPVEFAGMLAQPGFEFPKRRADHRFVSEDKHWRIAVNQSFIALTCDAYTRFEEFTERLNNALDLLIKIFSPPYFNRIGLRYKNLIWRPFLGIPDISWKELIPPSVAPELHSDVYRDKVFFFDKKVHLKEDNVRINITRSLVQASGVFRGTEFKDEEIYIIDADAYTEVKYDPTPTPINNTINTFNASLRSLFRDSITDKLHQSMEPAKP